MTSRWAVAVAPERDVTIHWRPISLMFKNDVQPDSPWFDKASRTHGLLRVFEAVRAEKGEAKLGDLYTAYGRRIHHDQNLLFDPAEALVEAGLPKKFAKATTDVPCYKGVHVHMQASKLFHSNSFNCGQSINYRRDNT